MSNKMFTQPVFNTSQLTPEQLEALRKTIDDSLNNNRFKVQVKAANPFPVVQSLPIPGLDSWTGDYEEYEADMAPDWQEVMARDRAPKCECGSHKAGLLTHSDWCQLYEERL